MIVRDLNDKILGRGTREAVLFENGKAQDETEEQTLVNCDVPGNNRLGMPDKA